jgi:hypothetical protein
MTGEVHAVEKIDLPLTHVEGVREYDPAITANPERFGALALLFSYVEDRKIYDDLRRLRRLIITLSLIPIGVIAWRIALAVQANSINHLGLDILKIIFFFVLLVGVVAIVGVHLFKKDIETLLMQLEQEAVFGRDMARFYLPMAREELKDINKKIQSYKEDAEKTPSQTEIIKNIMPLISFAFKKETSVIRWAIAGLRAYKTLSSIFKKPES